MSGPFEVRYAGDFKGNGLFATKPFQANEIIFEEKPLVAAQFAWNEAYNYSACHHCLRPLETAEENVRRLTNNSTLVLPYPQLCPTEKLNHRFCDLCGVGYCSEGCKVIAFKQHHNRLCPAKRPELLELTEKWKQMYYPPETTSVAIMLRTIATIESSCDKDQMVQAFLEFVHDANDENEQLFMKLFGPDNEHKIKFLQNELARLFPSPEAQVFVTEEGFKKLFALIGRNGQGIGTSVFAVWVSRVEQLQLSDEDRQTVNNFIDSAYEAMSDHVGSFLNCEGSGLYRLQRHVNHSCSPNATVEFSQNDFTLVLKTVKSIAPDEEICISYLDECMAERSRHTRQMHLRENYIFDCKCDKCIEQCDDPDVTSDDDDDDEEMES